MSWGLEHVIWITYIYCIMKIICGKTLAIALGTALKNLSLRYTVSSILVVPSSSVDFNYDLHLYPQ